MDGITIKQMTPEQHARLEQYRTVKEPYYTRKAKERRRANGTAAACGIPPFDAEVLKAN